MTSLFNVITSQRSGVIMVNEWLTSGGATVFGHWVEFFGEYFMAATDCGDPSFVVMRAQSWVMPLEGGQGFPGAGINYAWVASEFRRRDRIPGQRRRQTDSAVNS